jgi:uncharacterized protein
MACLSLSWLLPLFPFILYFCKISFTKGPESGYLPWNTSSASSIGLFYLLATSVPFIPNISKLAEATDISRPRLYEYLENLQDARLLNLVRSQGRGYEVLTRPDKIYLENSNLMYAISENVNTGTLRELFFVNQLRDASALHPGLVENTVELSGKGDLIVKSEYTFEIGGKGKGFNQISGVEKSFVVADNIETGFQNKIPLWLFGFLY